VAALALLLSLTVGLSVFSGAEGAAFAEGVSVAATTGQATVTSGGAPVAEAGATPTGQATAPSGAAVSDNGYPVTYAAFSSSYAATMHLPGTDLLRIQPVRTYLDRTRPMIALTFDDGPSQYTEEIVQLLGSYGCRATFCVLGSRATKQPERIRMAVAQGSEVVGHSWNHKLLTKLSNKAIKKDLQKTNKAIRAATGVSPAMYRPPYGGYDKDVRRVSKRQKLALLMWSYDTYDWKLRDARKLFKLIQEDVREGQIILMHDIHEQTAEAMEQVIPWLVEQGYELVTVSELFYYKGIKVKPGGVYNGSV
jgi:peptidoglycan/xylan/chitin deacetylase (PgdA/CDA1 family)